MNEKVFALKMNLQYFADDGQGGDSSTSTDNPSDSNNDNNSSSENENNSDTKIELTQEELLKRIESESDRKLESALKKKQREWEEETDKKIQEAIAEKERLSKLSEKERKEEELSKREKEIEKRLREIERKELLADARLDLKEKDLPVSLAETLLADDAEQTLKNINALKEVFDEAVNEKVKEKLRQDIPPAGGSSPNKKVHRFAEIRNKQNEQLKEAPDPWA